MSDINNSFFLDKSKSNYLNFINSCNLGDGNFLFTKNSDSSPFALCFGIFGYTLLRENLLIEKNCDVWSQKLKSSVRAVRSKHSDLKIISRDKSYLQLLTFTLSALKVLGSISNDPLEDLVLEVLPDNLLLSLDSFNILEGAPGSGNYAMFIAVLLIHARDFLGVDTKSKIEDWEEAHLSSLNSYGFWGKKESMTYLQFQNGYHQYEIFEYLNTPNVPWLKAADNVALLADLDGHFAPYLGGGGCFDYDALFFLTSNSNSIKKYSKRIIKLANAILFDQNLDGGFCESKRIRPRTINNLNASLKNVFLVKGGARTERLRQMLTLMRPKYNRIHTHWSTYSRKWEESDLWDSWFRMLSVARADIAINPENKKNWGFIDYPGIGFHPSLHN